MPQHNLALRSSRVVTPAGERPATVLVKDGSIAAVAPYDADLDASDVVDLGSDVLMPGLVDTHVHVNEPGRTECEGFATATRAAAAGGVTTLLDMPIGAIPPTTSVEALQLKRAAAEGQCFVDVGFWGGAISGNEDDLLPLHDAGVFGFKCFLVPEADVFPHLTRDELKRHLAILAAVDALMIAHAEDADVIASAPAPDSPRFQSFLASRPASAELVAIDGLIEAAQSTQARVHVVHLSAAGALPLVRSARASGVRISAETCPHYLTFVAGEIPDGATQFKCTPPIREEGNREQLWNGLAEGVLDCVVSDHAPCTREGKFLDTGDFDRAGPGISSLQIGLPAVWTEARKRGHLLTDVVRWMATNTARLAGLSRKGAIAEGYDADLVRFAPDETFVVDQTELLHKNPITAYEGRTLMGVVRATWLRGVEVGDVPRGNLLTRGDA